MDVEEWRKRDVNNTRNDEGLREIMAPGDALFLRRRRREETERDFFFSAAVVVEETERVFWVLLQRRRDRLAHFSLSLFLSPSHALNLRAQNLHGHC